MGLFFFCAYNLFIRAREVIEKAHTVSNLLRSTSSDIQILNSFQMIYIQGGSIIKKIKMLQI